MLVYMYNIQQTTQHDDCYNLTFTYYYIIKITNTTINLTSTAEKKIEK